MLRLWPEKITVGLFPGHCWLRRRGQVSTVETNINADAGALVSALDALLEKAKGRGANVDIIVSDKMARIVALPWQDQLRGEAERHAYALAAFGYAGVSVDDSWVCSTAFRRHCEQGLGIACRAEWLEQLEAIVQHHGNKLRTAMPVSVAAFWAPRNALGKGRSWVLVEECDRVASLSFNGGRLDGYDAQPTAGDTQGVMRLLRRQVLTTGLPTMISAWRVDGELRSSLFEVLAPEAKVNSLPRHYWDIHA